ncbi:unnamed protein product [Candidula unifasciata]|uniref:Centrosomal protein of 44 kDa n=1 Tax=Candidula unifasciata TaxID=100452 RepID=A0A8S3ZQ07_9EUPU|nr:unnamed protein product [Candidula unifasciata]
MATGDLKNNMKQLLSQLKATKFPQVIDIGELFCWMPHINNVDLYFIHSLARGSPQAYLAIYHYLFTSYSTELNSDIASSNNELYGKSDMRFMEAVYKNSSFHLAFAERKVIMATDILRLVYRRYDPPKSSSFRVAAAREETNMSPREKVHQEPVDGSNFFCVILERPRKIASKSSPDMAGAIVLPKRPSSAGFKIPKSSFPAHQVSNESPLFGAPSLPFRGHKQKQLFVSNAVRQESPDALIRRTFIDLVSPALVKVNDKIDKLQISLMEQLNVTCDLPSPAALTSDLTKQMSDVVFKLDTLTSRVFLIENRLIMIESKLKDEENNRGNLTESKSCHSSKIAAADSTHLEDSARGDRNNNSMASKEKEMSERRKDNNKIDRETTISSCVNSSDDEGNAEDLKVVVIREDTKQPQIKPSKMAFIKTLVSKNDLEDTLVSDASYLETSVNKNYQQAEPASSNIIKNLKQPFEDMVSPIKSYKQDESVMNLQYTADDSVNMDGRRSSTPSNFMLDDSTMDRVSRIHQMMTETKQLLH